MITINHMNFELIENYRDAFNEEQFVEKYSEVLNKYDYIVGDIGYEKLRLAGFYRDNKKKVDRDKKYSAIQDYLFEYCNFGCAYFVLRKVTKAEVKAMDQPEDVSDLTDNEDTEGQEVFPDEGSKHTLENEQKPLPGKTYAALKKQG
ncbi:YutD family protein [Corticicoccus populi]|uniref:YutD family protein n=1 Tax=Corticicoccus populi TaxID=1812821 RepID=A0ABW5WUS2_9STAP